jgi:hypothetical protein
MNLRHAAALALVGWYLIVPTRAAACGWYLLKPPVRQGVTDETIVRDNPGLKSATQQELHEIAPEYMGDWDAPLGNWEHEGSFDTAAGCEAAQTLLIKWGKAQEPEFRRKYPNGYPSLGTTLMRASRCIASDDPRLAK